MKSNRILHGRRLASLCLLSGGAWARVVAGSGGSITVKRASWRHRISALMVSILLALGTAAVQAAIPASERAVLLNLYASTNGATWTTSNNWNGVAGTECNWYGVTCGLDTVTGIALSSNNLTGSLPSDLNSLTNLHDFVASTNHLTGSIPALAGLTNLANFFVGGNQLTGSIPTLAGLTNLSSFHVEVNQLTGSIPALTGLTNLSDFLVGGNQLTGTIPALAGLTKLRYFDATNDQLTGSIPALTGLTSLTHFGVTNNRLTGTIPTLTGLTNLQIFQVGVNQLTGSIPPLAGLTNLVSFVVDNNQLTGSVPSVPTPNVLAAGGSRLCPNFLNHTADPAWDVATGETPWYTNCAGVPATLTVSSGSGQSTQVGTPFANPLVVSVKDLNGFAVPNATVTWTVPAVGASATLSALTSQTDANGQATVTATANAIAGTYSVVAAYGTLAATLSLTNTSTGVSATLTVSSGSGQSTRVGTPFAIPLAVIVKDLNGFAMPNATVTWTVPAMGASATLSALTSQTDANGQAAVTGTASAISGMYAVGASYGSLSVTISLTNAITIAAGNTCSGNAATNADLVEQYYAAILRRPSDSGGKAYWIGEADRLCALGVDPKETFYLLANSFYTSPEYLAFNRDNTSFVTDLYITFFSRLPDVGGLTYWTGQLASGMPRNNVMSSFLFSPEFTATMNGVFPGRTARAETYLVMNLYGGFFRRLADSGGYTYWDGRFRTAQCNSSPATAVQSTIDSVSSQFVASDEYKARNTTNSQYVQDLYYAMLQRGGDLTGFNFWVNQLDTSAMTRSQVRQQFLASPEMTAQSAAIAAQGCLPQ
jgi:hypothetical protein